MITQKPDRHVNRCVDCQRPCVTLYCDGCAPPARELFYSDDCRDDPRVRRIKRDRSYIEKHQ